MCLSIILQKEKWKFMKLYLIKLITLSLVVCFNTVNASNFKAEYNVSTSGIKIGKFNWILKVSEEDYYTEINLKNSGVLSPLYKFKGRYTSFGKIENDNFKTDEYKQNWETKKKTKVVEMLFKKNYLTELRQDPKEEEFSRIDLYGLFGYFDPITSFINILNGKNEAKTVDGRRIYIMKKTNFDDSKNVILKIKGYKNIWADHKRNDLKKIEFFLKEGVFLPIEIHVHFKDRIFKLKKV